MERDLEISVELRERNVTTQAPPPNLHIPRIALSQSFQTLFK